MRRSACSLKSELLILISKPASKCFRFMSPFFFRGLEDHVLPRERVLKTLAHQEPDCVPWGEHFCDYNVIEQLLGRPTLMHAKIRETKAMWEGRRDEVV